MRAATATLNPLMNSKLGVVQKTIKLKASVNGQPSSNVTIANHGSGMLNGSVNGPAGAPFSALGTGPFSFSPGGSKRLKVTFSPTSKGTFSAQLTITSDDPVHLSTSVPIVGTAK